MTMRFFATVLVIVLFLAVLCYFLAFVGRLLNSISATLGKVTFGVRAVETQCAVIGPAADQINANLTVAASNLTQAVQAAEALAGYH